MGRQKKRKARRPNAGRPKTPPPRVRASWRNWFTGKKLFVTLPASVIGALVTIHEVFGPPWPTAPEITPGTPTLSSSVFNVPLLVENPSILFAIHGPRFTCNIEKVILEHNNVAGDNTVLGGMNSPIAPTDSRPYKCTFPVDIKNARILSARITITIDYQHRLGLLVPRQTTVGPFTWDASTVPAQWLKGSPLQ